MVELRRRTSTYRSIPIAGPSAGAAGSVHVTRTLFGATIVGAPAATGSRSARASSWRTVSSPSAGTCGGSLGNRVATSVSGRPVWPVKSTGVIVYR